MNQVVVGRAHLVVARGLANSDPIVLNSATVFVGMSIDAHFYASLCLADACRQRLSNPMVPASTN
jgi:hypothetical protein